MSITLFLLQFFNTKNIFRYRNLILSYFQILKEYLKIGFFGIKVAISC